MRAMGTDSFPSGGGAPPPLGVAMWVCRLRGPDVINTHSNVKFSLQRIFPHFPGTVHFLGCMTARGTPRSHLSFCRSSSATPNAAATTQPRPRSPWVRGFLAYVERDRCVCLLYDWLASLRTHTMSSTLEPLFFAAQGASAAQDARCDKIAVGPCVLVCVCLIVARRLLSFLSWWLVAFLGVWRHTQTTPSETRSPCLRVD